MDIANYKTAVNRAGQVGHYPLSTETLDFIQEQIKLLSSIAKLCGSKTVMLKAPTTMETGIAILSGEVVEVAPLSGQLAPNTFYDLHVEQTSVDVATSEDLYKGARTMRIATLVRDEISGLKTDSRGEIRKEVYDLSTASEKIELLFEAIGLSSSIGDNPINVPLLDVTDEHFQRGIPVHHVVNSPEPYLGWDNPKYFFHKGNPEYELKGAVLKSQVVNADYIERPGLVQTLITRHGVIYERFIAPLFKEDRKFVSEALETDIPWHARPNTIIGTLSKTRGGDWVRSGILRYGDLITQGTALKLKDNRHFLLRPDKCCLQVSTSIPQSGPLSRVSWSLTLKEGLELNLPSTFFDNQFTSITITAIALP